MPDSVPAVSRIRALAAEGRPLDALDLACRAAEADPTDRVAKTLASKLVGRLGAKLDSSWIERIHRLLVDQDLDPRPIAHAGWRMLVAADRLPSPDAEGAQWAEEDGFLLALLSETAVANLEAEHALTALRRWLLLSGRASEFPRIVEALRLQALRNHGAWLFDAEERAHFERDDGAPLRPLYLPPRPAPVADASFGAPVVDAVARQYAAWPFPVWERLDHPDRLLAERIGELGPGVRPLPERPEVLCAGCGTGSELLHIARSLPGARITAIDISATSIAHARERIAAEGVTGIEFVRLDLNRVATLGKRFDLILCSGVLHHLPDPEAGWAALAGVLRPGALMRVMLYSRRERLAVRWARARCADLMQGPIDDDVLREARARLMTDKSNPIVHSTGFASLAGVYDLAVHEHEDPFDIPRIRAAIEAIGLEFIGFGLKGSAVRSRYRAEHPEDPWFRSFEGWIDAERRLIEPSGAMYLFWCAAPAG